MDLKKFEECFRYDPSSPSGLVWIAKSSYSQNKKNIGQPAGQLTGGGYYQVGFMGRRFQVHRIIFYLFNGHLPEYVDHIDGNTLNNSPENLREATLSQNAHNAKTRKDNKTGFKNVYFHKKSGRYLVNIQVNKKRHEFWSFETAEEANLFAIEKRKELIGEFNIDNRDISEGHK